MSQLISKIRPKSITGTIILSIGLWFFSSLIYRAFVEGQNLGLLR